MQRFSTCLWFDSEAEEAAHFYVSLFKDGKMGTIARYPEGIEETTGKPAGSVMTAEFEINGQKFMALNGGSNFKFSEAISIIINCDDQAEVDHYWEKLTADGGQESQCGWLKDKYGLSWQVSPKQFDDMILNGEPKKVQAAMKAMLDMKKLDLAALQAAYDNG